MSQRFLYTDIDQMPPELQAILFDRINEDLTDRDMDAWLKEVDAWLASRKAKQPPLVKTGQGDFVQEYSPEPRAFVDRRTAIVGAVMLLAVATLAFLVIASLP